MAVVRCPRCEAELEVADRLLGQPVVCGACGGVFDPSNGSLSSVAREVRQQRRSRQYDDDYSDDEDNYASLRPDARPARLPGILSACLCLLTLLILIAEVALILGMPQLMKNNPLLAGGPPPPDELLIGLRAFAGLWILVVLTASFRMMSGRNHGLAVAGMVMHLFPCTGLCWPLGLAVGVWGLIVLQRPEVKAGFEANELGVRDVGEDDDR